MNLEEFHAKHIGIIEQVYEGKADDYDMLPTLLVWDSRGTMNVVPIVTDDSPIDAAMRALAALCKEGVDPEFVSFASPAWLKTPAGERQGECIIIQTESAHKQHLDQLIVERTPLRLDTKKTPGLGHSRGVFLYHEKGTLQ